MQVGKIQKNICPICKKIANPTMGNMTTYYYCNNCSLGWRKSHRLMPYSIEYYKSGSLFLSKLFSPIAKFFYFIRESYVGTHQKNLWIDVGAGDGKFLQSVHAKKKIGVETSRAGIRIMKTQHLLTMTDKEFLKSNSLKASIISFWHMLEHVNNPWDYLTSAGKNLGKNGKIIIGVPNNESWELKLFQKYWFHLAPEFHIFHFSPKSIRKLLIQQGFVVEKIDYWSIEHSLTGLLQSVINYTTKSDGVLHNLIKRNTYTTSLTWYQLLIIFSWCTIGLPFVVLFWIISVLLKKSGTFVVVASRR